MSEQLITALDASYRALVGDRPVSEARLGVFVKEYSDPVEVRRNTFRDPAAAVASSLFSRWAGLGSPVSQLEWGVVGATPNGTGTFFRTTWTQAPDPSSGGVIVSNYSASGPHPTNVDIPIQIQIRSSQDILLSPQVQLYANGAPVAGGESHPRLTLKAGVWKEFNWIIRAANNSNGYQLRFYCVAAGEQIQAGTSLDLTEVLETATGPYFDGSTPALGRSTFHWADTPNASESYEMLYL